MNTCTVDGCDKPRKGRGLCRAHYMAALRAEGSGRTRYTRTCDGCGQEFKSQRPEGKLCSEACRSSAYSKPRTVSRLPEDHPVMRQAWAAKAERAAAQAERRATYASALARRAPLRQAWREANGPALIAAVSDLTERNEAGCWIWTTDLKNGYGRTTLGGRKHDVHRMVLEASLGQPLGTQAAHHVCANSQCVNPAHLQPVTARENTAEMLARKYMEQRITELEAALATHSPHHPLLTHVGVVRLVG